MTLNSHPDAQTREPETPQSSVTEGDASYQAPAIENVLCAADLEREVLYAGTPMSLDPPFPV